MSPAIPRAERLIVALDVPTPKEARALAEKLGDAVRFYKIGLELFTSDGYFELLAWLTARGNKVFADLKLYDIPETVRRAVANLSGRGATFLTVHGHRSVMEAAAREKRAMKILAVTVLTSFDQRDLQEFETKKTVQDIVLARARGAVESGCDGVIASGLEAKPLKKEFGNRLLVVTPGIRPVENRGDDQKRTVDVAQAFAAGADYIVVGRPVRDAKDPRAAAQAIQETIASIFPGYASRAAAAGARGAAGSRHETASPRRGAPGWWGSSRRRCPPPPPRRPRCRPSGTRRSESAPPSP
jgi:orotidine-5'-phosphate decarboxylase